MPDGGAEADGSVTRDGATVNDGSVPGDGATNPDGGATMCTDGTTTSAGRSKGESCSDVCGRETQAPEVVRCDNPLPPNTRPSGSTHFVEVQPWQVANDDGTEPAYPSCNLLEGVADKIFAQAGVDVVFLPWRAWNATAARVGAAENSCLDWVADDAPQHDDPTVLNLYLIDELNPGRIGGIGEEPGTTFFLCEECLGQSIHSLSHEMGHNLGLGHTNLGAAEDDHNLMSAAIPSNDIADVYPDGDGYLHLTDEQISAIIDSPAVKAIE